MFTYEIVPHTMLIYRSISIAARSHASLSFGTFLNFRLLYTSLNVIEVLRKKKKITECNPELLARLKSNGFWQTASGWAKKTGCSEWRPPVLPHRPTGFQEVSPSPPRLRLKPGSGSGRLKAPCTTASEAQRYKPRDGGGARSTQALL